MKGQRAGLPLMLVAMLAGVALAPGEDSPPSPPAGRPSITGSVVSSATGKPIVGARVELLVQHDPGAARERRARGEMIAEPVGRATTGDGGRFSIEAPAGARLVVVAEAPGHARSRLQRPIRVAEGSEARDVGRIELPAGRRLTGQVLDEAGRPVAGARVIGHVPRGRGRGGAGAGFARAFATGFPPHPVTAITGTGGAFTLESVPQRPVSLRVYAEGMAPALVEGSRVTNGVTVRLSAGHPLTGKVVAPDGRTPVPGAWVMVGDEGLDGTTRSKPDGTFRLDHVRAGTSGVVATIADAVVTGSAEQPLEAAATHAASAAVRVQLPPPGGAKTPVLRLRAGGIVRARALDIDTRQPVAGAVLLLEAPGEADPRLVVTGERGEAIFTGVPSGSVRLRAEAERYLEEDLGTAPLAAGESRRWTAALRRAASIEGFVRDAAGRPVAGAEVSVGGPPPFPLPVRIPVYFPIGVEPAVTDAQGRFVLEGLPPARDLKITVESEGYARWELPDVRLLPGERRSPLEVLLDGGLVLSGRLIDAEGQPVAGASVTASRRQEGGPFMVFRTGGGRGGPSGMGVDALPEVPSGPDGVFRVRGAGPGIWSLQIAARGFAPRRVGGLKIEESARALDAGDIRLEPGAAIRGRVVGAGGEPIAWARGSVSRELSVLADFTTGADGSFEAADLVPGEAVTLAVDADGHAAVEKGGLVPPVEELTITLASASRVMGQVIDRETRRPIADFGIAISRSRGGGGAGMMLSMRMAGPETPFHAEDGAFTIEDVDPGKVAVAARAPGYRESAMRDLEVPEGQDLSDLIFALERSASVSGTVTDDRGRPLPGVSVSRKETAGPAGMAMRLGIAGGATTDGDGVFVLEDLERGAMTLGFEHPDFEPAALDIDTSRDVDNLKVTMSRGAAITGIVVLDTDGSPVARASVTATLAGSDRFGGSRTASTGPDGSFVLEGVPAGRYTVRAEAAGLRAAATGTVVATGTAPSPLELRMGGGVTLTGTVLGAKEKELALLTVRAIASGSGGFGTTAAVDAAGRFEMRGMPAGTLTLMAGSGFLGGRTATRTIEIPEGAATFDTTIEFPGGHRVEGSVTRGGRPVDGASVIFMHTTARTSATATTDAAGRYVLEDLDDGEYTVSVLQMSTGISHQTKATVGADREVDIDLPVRRLTGFITDAATGRPIDGATVTFRREGAEPAPRAGVVFQQASRTDATGYYAIENLEEGTYTLTARRDGYGYETRTAILAAGAEPGEISFELSRVDALTFRATDSVSGQPLGRIEALVLSGGGGDPLSAAGTGATVVFQGSLSADASGVFRLDSLQPGTYRLVLGGQGVATRMMEGIRFPGAEQSFTVAPGGTVEVSAAGLKPGQTARAVLLDAQGHAVPVSTRLAEPAFTLRPGGPTILTDVPAGAWRVRAAMPGGGLAEVPVEVSLSAVSRVSLP